MEETLHPTHRTRMSDASSFDEICMLCGFTDQVPGGWGNLVKPCPGSRDACPKCGMHRLANYFGEIACTECGHKVASREVKQEVPDSVSQSS